ncbi:MAG: hypothetical protein AAF465_16100 [Pseudomonadota bacterium]
MLLRRLSQHVKEQNWTAVAIDFVIVVVGVFIGIQVANWNEVRIESAREAAILAQLKDEFSEIGEALTKQIAFREGYATDLQNLIAVLEGNVSSSTSADIERALVAARSTGRRPAKSAAYVQLTASGQLARLSSESLKSKLIRYHSLLDREAFIFPELMDLVVQESTQNDAVDFDVKAFAAAGAAVDYQGDEANENLKAIRRYDLAKLRQYEQRYELLHMFHRALASSERKQLQLVNDILDEVSADKR